MSVLFCVFPGTVVIALADAKLVNMTKKRRSPPPFREYATVPDVIRLGIPSVIPHVITAGVTTGITSVMPRVIIPIFYALIMIYSTIDLLSTFNKPITCSHWRQSTIDIELNKNLSLKDIFPHLTLKGEYSEHVNVWK